MMPKGFKSKTGYATVVSERGMGYREISEIMSKKGHKMNHSTARNIFLSAMKKLAKKVCDANNFETNEKELVRIAKDPRFQSGICDLIKEA